MDIQNALRQLIQPDNYVAMICKVDTVDKTARTIDCSPIDESAPMLGVNLQANQNSDFGICVFPEIGSFVVVGFIADGKSGVVLLTDKIESVEIVIRGSSLFIDANSVCCTSDKISFNGGKLGGLVIADKLSKRLNLIENDINSLKEILSSWIPAPQDGGAALKTVVSPWAEKTLTPSKVADYENPDIKH